jgi:parvulin-like peptidyl-prolyl isomerase
VALVLLVPPGACRNPPADPVILALGDLTVRRSEFEKHLRSLEERGLASPDPAVRRALLEPFLEEHVLVLEARRRRMLKAGSSQEEQRAAVQKLLTDEVLSKTTVAGDEIAAYYTDHISEFRTPETVVVRQILVSTQAEAVGIRRRLSRDPKSFESLAQSRSHSPEASAGGLMGSFSRGQLPAELEAAVFALPVAGLSEVVASPLGFHVLRLDARDPARDRSLDECRGEIRAMLMQEQAEQATRQFVRELLARAKVNHEAADLISTR